MEIRLFLLMTYSSTEGGGTAPHFLTLPPFFVISHLSTRAKEEGMYNQVNPSFGPSSNLAQLKQIQITALPHN